MIAAPELAATAPAALPFFGATRERLALGAADELTFLVAAAGLVAFADFRDGAALAATGVVFVLTDFFAVMGLDTFFAAVVLVGFFAIAALVGAFAIAALVGAFAADDLAGLAVAVVLLRLTVLAVDFWAAAAFGALVRLVVRAGVAARADLAAVPVLDPLAWLVDLPVRAVARAARVVFGFLASPRFGM